jgi:hypothetical protein
LAEFYYCVFVQIVSKLMGTATGFVRTINGD